VVPEGRRGVDLISDALPFGRLWYGGLVAVSNAIGYSITADQRVLLSAFTMRLAI
jgi:hypothetical protein